MVRSCWAWSSQFWRNTTLCCFGLEIPSVGSDPGWTPGNLIVTEAIGECHHQLERSVSDKKASTGLSLIGGRNVISNVLLHRSHFKLRLLYRGCLCHRRHRSHSQHDHQR